MKFHAASLPLVIPACLYDRMKDSFGLRLQRNFFQRTDRVKGVDIHPTEPW